MHKAPSSIPGLLHTLCARLRGIVCYSVSSTLCPGVRPTDAADALAISPPPTGSCRREKHAGEEKGAGFSLSSILPNMRQCSLRCYIPFLSFCQAGRPGVSSGWGTASSSPWTLVTRIYSCYHLPFPTVFTLTLAHIRFLK